MEFKQLDDSKATTEGVNDLVLGNNQLTLDLYKKFDSSSKNVFFSPFSISTALSMTYEGAAGKTAEEMRSVLHLQENDITRQSSFAKIFNKMNADASSGNYVFNLANAIWMEKTYVFDGNFTNILQNYYYGKITNVDFKNTPDASRLEINSWVNEQTKAKIKEILPTDSIQSDTKLVLTNAIYFKGDWATKFKKENTMEKEFLFSNFDSPENKIPVQMMSQTAKFKYFEDGNFQYLKMPYKGDKLSMLVMLPVIFHDYDAYTDAVYDYKQFDLPSAEEISSVTNRMQEKELLVSIPKFEFETEYTLKDTLLGMGMVEAFDNKANFSRMDPANFLKIDQIYHDAYVKVDEEGTEAAAATAVVMVVKSAMPSSFNANHPFAFAIVDNETGLILFMGKVVDPTKN
jgi:serpin B